MRRLTVLLSFVVLSFGYAQDCEDGFRLFDHEALTTNPICIPENPQRPAFLSGLEMNVYALEDVSVPTRSFYSNRFFDEFSRMFSEGELAEKADVGAPSEPNLEVVVGANPDLIFVPHWAPETTVSSLEQIAPTLVLQEQLLEDWRPYFRLIADIFAQKERAESVISGVEERLAAARDEVQAADAPSTYAIVGIRNDGQYQTLTKSSFYAQHVEALGLTMPDAVLSPEESGQTPPVNSRAWYPQSFENLEDVDADVIFLVNADDEDARAALTTNPIWQQLKAVRNDQVYVVDNNYWSEANPIASHRIIDDLLQIFEVDSAEIAPNPFSQMYQ